ncbi:uncharacterized protein LOC143512956 isoform X2 [Brachyhypopomus gauderio]|uniref:uncharacterized protein LOC143512956 isoform X2 n=1 Tax=Brachyhypopomus gauderio TaxID=698409 RepID=UPI004040F83F
MENIADLLKDAFSEVDIDFEDLQFDDGNNTAQTQLVMDEDLKEIRKLWATSAQGSNKTLTDVYKQEENADSPDNVEKSALCNLSDKTGSTLYLPRGVDFEQDLKQTIMETQQLNQTYEEFTGEEESRKGNSEAGVVADVNTQREEKFREERTTKHPFGSPEGQEVSNTECQPFMEQASSYPVSSRTQMMRKRSSVSDGEESDSCNAEDQTSHWKPDGSQDKLFVAGYHVGHDLREFMEDYQEQMEESLDLREFTEGDQEQVEESVDLREFTEEDQEQVQESLDRREFTEEDQEQVEESLDRREFMEDDQEQVEQSLNLREFMKDDQEQVEESLDLKEFMEDDQEQVEQSLNLREFTEDDQEQVEQSLNLREFTEDDQEQVEQSLNLREFTEDDQEQVEQSLNLREFTEDDQEQVEESLDLREFMKDDQEQVEESLDLRELKEEDQEQVEQSLNLREFMDEDQDQVKESFDLREFKEEDQDQVEQSLDLREFTEEDQEQVEESLADYPSDLFQSETERCAENGRDQLSIPLDNSFCDNHFNSAHVIKDSSWAEEGNFQERARKINCPAIETNAEITKLEIDQLSNMADINVPLQWANANEDNLEEIPIEEYKYIRYKEDSGDERDVNDQPGYDSDISNDDHSTSQEETSFFSSEKEKWESVTQHNNFTEDMVMIDNNINYTETDKDDINGSHLEKLIYSEAKERTSTSKTSLLYGEYCHKKANEQPTVLNPNFQIAQLGSAIKEHGQSLSQVTDNIRDTNTLIPEAFWSTVLMGDGNLELDEYNWNLTDGELPEVNLNEETKLEEIEALEELDCEDGENNDRDWEKEKPRIEAFFHFYGDQTETQNEVGRNHKVTFCLDHELSDYEEDSESSEEEQEKEPHTPVTTVKPEDHSESDEPQKLFDHKKSKARPKEQEHVSPALKTRPTRNVCLAVLKSAFALGLMTTVGVVSFWWATDILDWTH